MTDRTERARIEGDLTERDADVADEPLEEPLDEPLAVASLNAVLPAIDDDADVREGETAEDEARRRR